MQNAEIRAAQVGFMRGLDWRATAGEAPSTKTLTLILRSEHDTYGTLAASNALCQALPNSRFVAIAGAGHVVQEDQPPVADHLVEDFLGGYAHFEPDRCQLPKR